jgi:vanillate monooxygenase ferredoxin subunit
MNTSFTIKIASTGALITVSADQTVVQALASGGIELPTSCEQGVCGTCLTGIKEGIPDHRDMYLSGEEQDANDQFTPCCSRSKSSILILDL